VTLPLTLRLELPVATLPEDYVQDFKGIMPLSFPVSTADVLYVLQDYLAQASPNNVVAYASYLSTVLVTAYQAGYSKEPWVQEMLREWRSKRGEYSLNGPR
jgi:hypothetical protein